MYHEQETANAKHQTLIYLRRGIFFACLLHGWNTDQQNNLLAGHVSNTKLFTNLSATRCTSTMKVFII